MASPAPGRRTRLPLVAESLASGALVEPLPRHRMESPLVYWLVLAKRSAQRPEVQAFAQWLQVQAAATRDATGDVPDPDAVDHLDQRQLVPRAPCR